MYRCEVCKEVVAPKTPVTRIVTETRAVQYPYRPEVNREIYRGKERIKPDDPGGSGREIVREVIACPRCAGKA